jgi:uncharacterized membrane-anchored protein
MPSERNKTKRRWRLQLRLSTALLVVTIIAILCAWIVDHRQLSDAITRDTRKLDYFDQQVRVLKNQVMAANAESKAVQVIYESRLRALQD